MEQFFLHSSEVYGEAAQCNITQGEEQQARNQKPAGGVDDCQGQRGKGTGRGQGDQTEGHGAGDSGERTSHGAMGHLISLSWSTH